MKESHVYSKYPSSCLYDKSLGSVPTSNGIILQDLNNGPIDFFIVTALATASPSSIKIRFVTPIILNSFSISLVIFVPLIEHTGETSCTTAADIKSSTTTNSTYSLRTSNGKCTNGSSVYLNVSTLGICLSKRLS